MAALAAQPEVVLVGPPNNIHNSKHNKNIKKVGAGHWKIPKLPKGR